MEVIRIPEERVGVLLGENGKIKRIIEEKAEISLNIASDGEVTLDGEEEKVYFACDIIKAIGRGFSPKIALKLLKDEKAFAIINLKESLNTVNSIRRIKARVIGGEGKVKKEIESATDCDLCIYGHTISIIGNYDCIEYAKKQ